MRKGALKYIIGGSIVLVGIILVTVAVCIDGWKLFTRFPTVQVDFNGVHVEYGGDWDGENGEYIYNENGGTVMDSEVKTINIDVDYGMVNIRRGNVDQIDIRTRNIVESKFRYEVKGDTLYVKYKRGFTMFSFGNMNTEINVTFPENAEYDNIFVHNGAGAMYLYDLKADEIKIDNGAGEMKMENVASDGKVKINTGAGAIKLENVSCGELRIDSGVGEVYASDMVCNELTAKSGIGAFTYKGEINGDADIDNGCGEVKMTVYGKSSDYGFDVDSGIGQVRVNGNTPVNGSGKYGFKVKTGVGEVRIDIKDKGE